MGSSRRSNSVDIEGDAYPEQTAYLISGSIDNWRPQKMYEISEFCKMLDPDGKHEGKMYNEELLLHVLKKRKEISTDVKTVLDLTERGKQIYKEEMAHHRREYRHKAFKILKKTARYTNVDYINGE